MNEFDNTGVAVRLPKQTEGTYGALIRAKDQLRQSQQFQQKMAADAQEFNYKMYKDLSDVDFKDLDGVHKQAISAMTKNYLEKTLNEYDSANKQGRRMSPMSSAKEKQTLQSAADRMLAHQQELGALNKLTAEKKGWYNEQLGIDALKTVYETGEDGKVNPNSPNLNSPAGSVLALAQDPKYINVDKALDDITEEMGKTVVTTFGTFKDPKSGEFFDKEEDVEVKTIYGSEIKKDPSGRPIPQASVDVLSKLYADQPLVHKALVLRAEANGVDPVVELQKIFDSKYKGESKGADYTRIARPKPSGSGANKAITVDVVSGGSGEFEDKADGSKYVGDSIPLPSLVSNVTITEKGTSDPSSMDFEGIYIDPSTKKPAFRFTTSESYNSRILRNEYKPIDDQEIIATLRNKLPEGSPKRVAFEEALSRSGSLGYKSIGFNDETVKAKSLEIVDKIRYAGDFKKKEKGDNEQTLAAIQKIGSEFGIDVSDITPVKSVFAKSIKIKDTDGVIKELRTTDDAEKIAQIIAERIKGKQAAPNLPY